MKFNEYVVKEVNQALSLDESMVKWGMTSEAKKLPEVGKELPDPEKHTHMYFIDPAGNGRTTVCEGCQYAHQHLILDGKIVAEGDHTHDLGKQEGTVNELDTDKGGYDFNAPELGGTN